jgi:enoyl-CoA hydratase/carnithine racemase
MATATAPCVCLSLDGPLATLVLNRPEKLNALSPDMLADLEAVADDLDANSEVRAVILTGAGDRAFSVGADIDAWSALEPLDMWRTWVPRGHRVFDRLAHLRQPLIAALNGFAFGGGLELALAADLRLARSSVQLGMPEVKLGTVTGWAGTRRLPELIGPARAKQLIFTGARLDAATAERWGLVNEVVDDDLLDRARTLALEIADNAPVSVQIAKQIIDCAGDAFEALAGALAATTADAREGLAAFHGKRGPQFIGY